MKAVTAIRDLKQSDLQLNVETKGEQGQTEVTFISSEKSPMLLNRQLASLKPVKDSILSRVKVFRSLDGEMSLNVFFYENSARKFISASEEDAATVFAFAQEVQAGKHSSDPLVKSILSNPESLSRESIIKYLKHVSPAHTRNSDPRRWLIQRGLFDKVITTLFSSIVVLCVDIACISCIYLIY